ncbi:methyltransferase domain-containing protein [Amycolatopsis sp. NPDC004169]|uniref:class I SAM-dependent methyltransferase n=1 Tax=Amycolatopsis sp. NPDC004169 TaxID=3154453 RepID=UPI0033A5BF59
MSDIEGLRAFYDSAVGESIFDVWERGGARGDSITPSTFSDSYRAHIGAVLRDRLGAPGSASLLSIGCGNAVVEAELARAGYEVLAVDALDEAVRLAEGKGLRAVKADVATWEPGRRWDVVYADGLLGHLYDAEAGLQPILTRVRSWLAGPRGTLVVSNDAPKCGLDAEPAPGVPGFHWLSNGLLEAEAKRAGFDEVSSSAFVYERPISGPRERAIVVAA